MTAIIITSIFSTIPMVLIWPHVGILVWFWIGLMNPHRLAWGAASEMSVAFYMGIVTLGAWLFSREPKKIPVTAVTVLLGLLTVWITVSTTFAMVPDNAWPEWNRDVKILAMTLVTIAIMATRERIHALVWMMVVCLGFYSVKGGLFTILGGAENRVWGPRGSFIEDNNQLAMALLMVLPFMRYLQLQSESRYIRLGLLAAMAMTVFSIIGSQSRGAFLGLLVVGSALVIKSRYRLQIGTLVLVVGLVGAWFVPEHWIERMKTIETYQEDSSAEGRITTWKVAFQIALRRPLTGGGFNVTENSKIYRSIMPDASKPHSAHSVYFEVLGEHGFVGLLIFLSLGYVTWRTFGAVRKEAAGKEPLRWALDLAAMGQVSLLAYFSAGAFLNLAFFDLYYLVVALAVLLKEVVRREGVRKHVSVAPFTAAQAIMPGIQKQS
jgi:probable O-glycosylation ligase (exosortase A-associated)